MEMEASVLRFIGFIVVEILFILSTLPALAIVGNLIYKNHDIKNSYSLVTSILMSLVSIIFIYLCVFILAGESYLIPFGIVLLSTFVMMAVVEFVWLFFKHSSVPWFGRLIWIGHEFKAHYPTLQNVFNLLALGIFIFYPVYIGIFYFGEEFYSPDWPKFVLRATLFILIGTPLLLQMPYLIKIMVSKNVMEATRSRVFVNQLAGTSQICCFRINIMDL